MGTVTPSTVPAISHLLHPINQSAIDDLSDDIIAPITSSSTASSDGDDMIVETEPNSLSHIVNDVGFNTSNVTEVNFDQPTLNSIQTITIDPEIDSAETNNTANKIDCGICFDYFTPDNLYCTCPGLHMLCNSCMTRSYETTRGKNLSSYEIRFYPNAVRLTTKCAYCSFPLIETPKQLYDIVAGMLKVKTILNAESESDPVYRYVLKQDRNFPEARKWEAIKGHIKYFKTNSSAELADKNWNGLFFVLLDIENAENLKIFAGLDLVDKGTLVGVLLNRIETNQLNTEFEKELQTIMNDVLTGDIV